MPNSNKSLTQTQIDIILQKSESGVFSSYGKSFPYSVPVNFVYYNNKIYIHGKPEGQKIQNIKNNPNVCFVCYKMIGLLYDNEAIHACNVNTEYESVIVNGTAKVISDFDVKKEVLNKIVEKYTPELLKKEMPEKAVMHTAVIEISITDCSGKFYK